MRCSYTNKVPNKKNSIYRDYLISVPDHQYLASIFDKEMICDHCTNSKCEKFISELNWKKNNFSRYKNLSNSMNAFFQGDKSNFSVGLCPRDPFEISLKMKKDNYLLIGSWQLCVFQSFDDYRNNTEGNIIFSESMIKIEGKIEHQGLFDRLKNRSVTLSL